MSKLLRHGMTLIIDNKETSVCFQPMRDNYSAGGQKIEDSLLESVFITALEQATKSSWRLVCMALAVEQHEPYRTCFLSKETRDLLLLWHTWQNSAICDLPIDVEKSDLESFCPQKLVLNVDIYRPLEPTGGIYQPGAGANQHV